MSSVSINSPATFQSFIYEKFGDHTNQLYRTDGKPVPKLKDDTIFQRIFKIWIVFSFVFSIGFFFTFKSIEDVIFEVNFVDIITVIIMGILLSTIFIFSWKLPRFWMITPRKNLIIILSNEANIELYQGLKVKDVEKDISISNSDEEFVGILTSHTICSTLFRDEKTRKYDTTTATYIISKKPFKECTSKTMKNHCILIGEMVNGKDIFGEDTEVKIGDEIIPNEKIVFIQ